MTAAPTAFPARPPDVRTPTPDRPAYGYRVRTDAHDAALRKTLELLLADPASWDQATWGVHRRRDDATADRDADLDRPACRTAYCLAGHYAVNVAGYEPLWYDVADAHCAPTTPTPVDRRTLLLSNVMFVEEGQTGERHTWSRNVGDVAEEGLGLTPPQASMLFNERNSLRRLVELSWLWTGGRVDLLDAYADVVARDARLAQRERDAEADHRDALACEVAYARVRPHPDADYGDDDGHPIDDRAAWERVYDELF